MAIRAEFDREADALYVYLEEGEPAVSTVEVDHAISVDRAAGDRVIGVEVLSPHKNLPRMPSVAREHGFVDGYAASLREIRRALFDSTYGAVPVPMEVDVTTTGTACAITGSASVGGLIDFRRLSPGSSLVPEPA